MLALLPTVLSWLPKALPALAVVLAGLCGLYGYHEHGVASAANAKATEAQADLVQFQEDQKAINGALQAQFAAAEAQATASLQTKANIEHAPVTTGCIGSPAINAALAGMFGTNAKHPLHSAGNP